MSDVEVEVKVEADVEVELVGVTGSRSVTRRMVKRGGTVMHGGVKGEVGEGRDTAAARGVAVD